MTERRAVEIVYTLACTWPTCPTLTTIIGHDGVDGTLCTRCLSPMRVVDAQVRHGEGNRNADR